MKSTLSTLLILFFTIPSFAQMSEYKYVGKRDSKGQRTGLWKTYIGSTLFETQVYKEGKENGEYILYNIWNDDDPTVVSQKGQYTNSKRVGKWTSYHKNGNISEVGSYSNSQRIGSWKKYHESGKLESVTNFLDGKKSGEFYSLYGDGSMQAKGNYIDDKRVGEWLYYRWSEGKESLKKIQNFSVRGDTVGKWVEYDDTNKIKLLKTYDQSGVLNGAYEENKYNRLVEKGNYVNGKRNGIWEFGNSDQNIWKEVIEYKDGKKNGLYEKKRTSTSNLAKGTYTNDLKEGNWEETESTGALGKGVYTAGKRSGLWKFYGGRQNGLIAEILYDPNGIELSTKQFYEDGTLGKKIEKNLTDGSIDYNEYYSNSQPKMTGRYIDNKQSGEWKEYYDNGKLARVINYKDGVPNGDYTIYFANDQVKMRASFQQGKLWNVLEMKDKEGNTLDHGTLKNGNGTLIEYDDNGNLSKVLNFVNGQQQN